MRVLQDHFLKNITISKDVCHKAYKYLTRNQLNKDGFDILTIIILENSPQLGDEMKDDEELVEFYHCTKTIEYKVSLQKIGQHQRLTR